MTMTKARVSSTPSFDPRFDRAQTVDGAKARYISHDTDYGIKELEQDLERLLDGNTYLDANPKQDATRELFARRP